MIYFDERWTAARFALISPTDGVVAASGGNHGLAVAHVARQPGIPAQIFVPEAASSVKVARVRALGTTVTVTGAMYADTYDACLRHSATSDALFVHAYAQPEVVAGQGTLGRELLAQADVDTVLVAVGGGGQISWPRSALGVELRSATTRVFIVRNDARI